MEVASHRRSGDSCTMEAGSHRRSCLVWRQLYHGGWLTSQKLPRVATAVPWRLPHIAEAASCGDSCTMEAGSHRRSCLVWPQLYHGGWLTSQNLPRVAMADGVDAD